MDILHAYHFSWFMQYTKAEAPKLLYKEQRSPRTVPLGALGTSVSPPPALEGWQAAWDTQRVGGSPRLTETMAT